MMTPPYQKIMSRTALLVAFAIAHLLINLRTNVIPETTNVETIQQQQPRRRLRRLSEEIISGPILNEETIQQQVELNPVEMQEKHIKQYLGGLYPKVDRQFHPLYLRDSLHPREIDPKWGEVVDGDIPFFWHIPKASGSTMKNVMNFCFNLKRAEKVYGEAVSSVDIYYCSP